MVAKLLHSASFFAAITIPDPCLPAAMRSVYHRYCQSECRSPPVVFTSFTAVFRSACVYIYAFLSPTPTPFCRFLHSSFKNLSDVVNICGAPEHLCALSSLCALTSTPLHLTPLAAAGV